MKPIISLIATLVIGILATVAFALTGHPYLALATGIPAYFLYLALVFSAADALG